MERMFSDTYVASLKPHGSPPPVIYPAPFVSDWLSVGSQLITGKSKAARLRSQLSHHSEVLERLPADSNAYLLLRQRTDAVAVALVELETKQQDAGLGSWMLGLIGVSVGLSWLAYRGMNSDDEWNHVAGIVCAILSVSAIVVCSIMVVFTISIWIALVKLYSDPDQLKQYERAIGAASEALAGGLENEPAASKEQSGSPRQGGDPEANSESTPD